MPVYVHGRLLLSYCDGESHVLDCFGYFLPDFPEPAFYDLGEVPAWVEIFLVDDDRGTGMVDDGLRTVVGEIPFSAVGAERKGGFIERQVAVPVGVASNCDNDLVGGAACRFKT